MFRNSLTFGLGFSFLALATVPAVAQQIVLSTDDVIGGGAIYDSAAFNGPDYSALNVLDNQDGVIGAEIQGFGYWITPNGVSGSAAYFVIDLGGSYLLNAIELFNTHNGYFFDRGTDGFQIEAGNDVSFIDSNRGYNLVDAATILTGNLPPAEEAAPTVNSFTSSNGLSTGDVAYRYLRFSSTSYHISGGGLNEIRVFGAVVPEPSSVPEPSAAASLAGVVALGGVVASRRRRAGDQRS